MPSIAEWTPRASAVPGPTSMPLTLLNNAPSCWCTCPPWQLSAGNRCTLGRDKAETTRGEETLLAAVAHWSAVRLEHTEELTCCPLHVSTEEEQSGTEVAQGPESSRNGGIIEWQGTMTSLSRFAACAQGEQR